MTLTGDELPPGVLDDLLEDIGSGKLHGLCLVAIHADGGFEPLWFASKTLGPHAGSILRGAVCWLGAEMDLKARSE